MKKYKKFFNNLKGILSKPMINYTDYTIVDNNSDIYVKDYENIENDLKNIITNGITEYYLGDKLIKNLIELFRYDYNDLKEKEGEITILYYGKTNDINLIVFKTQKYYRAKFIWFNKIWDYIQLNDNAKYNFFDYLLKNYYNFRENYYEYHN